VNSKDSCKTFAKPCRAKSKKKEVVQVQHYPLNGEEICLEALSSRAMWGDDFKASPFPLEEMSVDEMLLFLLNLREKYPDHHLVFKLEHAPRMFGEVNWWELKGIRRES
jgi:hypothetical protein